MNADLEQYLWERIRRLDKPGGHLPRTVIAEMVREKRIQSPKQAWRTLEKWSDRGWYDYGVTLDLGWRERETLPHEGHPATPGRAPARQ